MRNIHEFEVKNLLRMANDAKERAYVPYSGFRVGACLKGASGVHHNRQKFCGIARQWHDTPVLRSSYPTLPPFLFDW